MKQAVLIGLFVAGSALAMLPASDDKTTIAEQGSKDSDSTSTSQAEKEVASNDLCDGKTTIGEQGAKGSGSRPSSIRRCFAEFDQYLYDTWRPCFVGQQTAANQLCREQVDWQKNTEFEQCIKQNTNLDPCKQFLFEAGAEVGACIADSLKKPGVSDTIHSLCRSETGKKSQECTEQYFACFDKVNKDDTFRQCGDNLESVYYDCVENRARGG